MNVTRGCVAGLGEVGGCGGVRINTWAYEIHCTCVRVYVMCACGRGVYASERAYVCTQATFVFKRHSNLLYN